MVKITFFLMTRKGYLILKEILLKYNKSLIDKVICSRDLSIEKDYYQEIKKLCEQYQIPFFSRKDIYHIESKFCFAISWRWIIKLDSTQKLIVFHDSLLPKYRGFAPLVNSLIKGERKIGVTAFFANSKYDEGDIIEQDSSYISYPIKIVEAIDIIVTNYCNLICKILDEIISGQDLVSYPQDHFQATYSVWRDEEDYRINWNDSAENIKRFIDAVGYPYLGAYSIYNNVKYRILDAEKEKDKRLEIRQPGKVLVLDKGNPIIICKQGLLKITKMVENISKKPVLPMKKVRVRFT